MKKSIEFTGVYPAMITSMKADGSLDIDGIKANAKALMDMGCSGLCLCGSTGEAAFLTREERVQVIKAAKEVLGGKGKIIAGTGSPVTSVALQFTKDAKEAGADAVLVISPIGNTSTEGLVKHYETIAEVGLPVILYNYPAATGISITADIFDRLIAIPNVIGMKESGGNIGLLAEILYKYHDSNLSLFTGADDQILPAFALGLKATILATANVAPKQAVDILRLVQEGKLAEARKIFYNIIPLVGILGAETNFPACFKKAVELLGRPAGKPRLPLLPMPEDEVPALKEAMKIAGVL